MKSKDLRAEADRYGIKDIIVQRKKTSDPNFTKRNITDDDLREELINLQKQQAAALVEQQLKPVQEPLIIPGAAQPQSPSAIPAASSSPGKPGLTPAVPRSRSLTIPRIDQDFEPENVVSKTIPQLSIDQPIEEGDEEEGGQEGAGKGKGLYDDEIEAIMSKYKEKGWKGVYSIDQIKDIPRSDKMAFIMNLDPSTKPGSHWVGVFIDTKRDKSLEYFDPLAEEPPKQFSKDIKEVIEELNPDVYLKYKINKVKHQSDKTDTCGWHVMKWLMRRLNGIPWVECSGWSQVHESESKIKKFKKSFGYI